MWYRAKCLCHSQPEALRYFTPETPKQLVMESTASCSDPDYITKNNTRVVLSPLLMSASLSPTIKKHAASSYQQSGTEKYQRPPPRSISERSERGPEDFRELARERCSVWNVPDPDGNPVPRSYGFPPRHSYLKSLFSFESTLITLCILPSVEW